VKTIYEQMVAEFLGTFALVFIGAGSVVLLSQALGGGTAILGIALAHGLVLAVMVSGLGHLSGGHFNPAVTVGAWVAGKIETARGAWYVLAQALGAVAGAALLQWAMPKQLWETADLGATTLARAQGINTGKGILIEATLTFFLVLTVFAVAVDDRGVFSSIAGLPIGLVLTFDILVGGYLTGASMNPARTFGPALLSGTWDDFWVYIIGPVTGSVIAASIYWLTFLRGREVVTQRTETPIGGGPEEDLPAVE
jgi:MIP family channel proteins